MEVVQYLKKHNVPIKSVGFRYLTEAVKASVEDGTLPYHMYKLYKPIAKEHATTTKNVERCVRYAISKSDMAGLSNCQFIIEASIQCRKKVRKPKNHVCVL